MDSLAICEDEGYMLEKLREMTESYGKSRGVKLRVRTFLSGEELMQAQETFDVLLLDLKLPGIGGVEAAKSFGGRSQIIFVTAYREYALEAFDVGAVHYLVKPVSKERLFSALDRADERIRKAGEKAVTLMKKGVLFRVRMSEITYCEVFDHRCLIHTPDGCYEYSGTLDMLSQKLDKRFFRCHRSFLVNMDQVIRQEKGWAVLAGGEWVMVSRRRQQEFMQRLLGFLKDEVI